jgi:hypothetical protein
MLDDNLKDQRAAFDFLREKFRSQESFTKIELQQKTSWDWKSVSTYWSKQFEPFVKPVSPILKGSARKDQKYRVTRAFLPFGTWTKFRRHVSQKRRLTFEYDHSTYETVLLFDFFLPLTNETVLRMSLDSLFYKDTIQKQLLAIGIQTLRQQFKTAKDLNDDEFLQELATWIGDRFGGYSISHVSGRFKARPDKGEPAILTMQEATALQERAGRYLIDETTAITRFIFPCRDKEEAETVRWFFFQLFVESVIEVSGEAEVWMIESGLQTRLHTWSVKQES